MFVACPWRTPALGLGLLIGITLSGFATGAADSPVLDLRAVLARTLEESPELGVFPYRERAADALIFQAGLRPNPELSVELGNIVGTGLYSGFDRAEATLALSQVIELGDKRENRTLLAGMNRELVGVDYEVARLDILAEAARRFISVARAQALLELARHEEQLAERALAVAKRRAESGRASPVDESRARIAVVQATIAKRGAEHDLASARMRLAASWGETNPMFREVHADLFRFPAVPPFDFLRARLDDAPILGRYLTLERIRAAELRLAESGGRQDARVGLGLRRFEESGESALMLQFSVPLPFSDRNQGRISAARAEWEMTDAERRQARVAVHSSLFEIHQELQHARAEAAALQDDALPEAQQALARIESGYEAGRFSYLELIEARRQRLGIERAAIEAASSFHRLLLELERLTGDPIVAPPAATTEQEG
jgi:outer membrane protein, heavy metal efflux system